MAKSNLQSVRAGTQQEPRERHWSRSHGGLCLLPGSLWLMFCSLLPSHRSDQESAPQGVPVVSWMEAILLLRFPLPRCVRLTTRFVATITVFKLKSELVVEGLKTELFCSGNQSCGSPLPGTPLFCLCTWLDLGFSISLVWPQNEKFANVGCEVIVVTLTWEPKQILCWF